MQKRKQGRSLLTAPLSHRVDNLISLSRVCGICRIPADCAVIRNALCKTCRRYSRFDRAVADFAEVVQ